MRLYLASTSPARRALLVQAGIDPVIIPSDVDEDAHLADLAASRGTTVAALAPADIVLELARAKALAVADALGARDPDTGGPLDGFVLGGDSMFELDGVVYGKPYEPAVARERWLQQRGRTGTLWSGHWLVDRRANAGIGAGTGDADAATGVASDPRGVGIGAVARAEVTFVDDLTEAEIDAYVATGEPLQVAGAFTIDSLGGPFIERVDGDPSTVVGMSLSTVRRLAREFGVAWHEFWPGTDR